MVRYANNFQSPPPIISNFDDFSSEILQYLIVSLIEYFIHWCMKSLLGQKFDIFVSSKWIWETKEDDQKWRESKSTEKVKMQGESGQTAIFSDFSKHNIEISGQ
jgi:hypothetical protein